MLSKYTLPEYCLESFQLRSIKFDCFYLKRPCQHLVKWFQTNNGVNLEVKTLLLMILEAGQAILVIVGAEMDPEMITDDENSPEVYKKGMKNLL